MCVAIHHRMFELLTTHPPRVHVLERHRVTLGIVGAIGAHLVEIGVFAVAMSLLHRLPAGWHVGDLQGAEAREMTDSLYCSAMSYTTLGLEGVSPVGAIRLLVGIEALPGLVLVAWSVSFTYVQMENYWSTHQRK
ncbi:MAG TPA: ion channel [Planctomycetota bacterium]|nr:ion channel [Planctomycetota bacterium]